MAFDNKLIHLSIGAATGAVLALALAVVALDLAQLPKLWAYVFLGLICLVIAVNVFLLFWGRRVTDAFFGVTSDQIQDVFEEAAKDVEAGAFGDLIKTKAPIILSSFAAFRARMISVFLLLALLGELVLVVQVAALIEQTNAIKTQTERLAQQTLRDLFWQLHNDAEHTNQVRAFRELLIIGQIEFSNFRFRNTDLSGMNLPNVRFSSSDFGGSLFVGTTMLNASIERTNLRGSDFSKSTIQGTFEGSNFAEVNFSGASLSGNFNQADFALADLTGASLEGASFEGTNFTGAVVTPDVLAKSHHLQNAVGIPQDVMVQVKQLNPELLRFWEPNN
ncbi:MULTISPECIES: pentapeptide repeat-containing protein [unclassified Roseovarius]|uniref:pentapeptide repeat-containing protein n=1 Tax=unclassified Roseovarius TaxID=2614913 RepID=UPI00273F6DEC|nr:MULTISPECIES: pentapeptide repeat-containing protein [unclassified Roseovarius]